MLKLQKCSSIYCFLQVEFDGIRKLMEGEGLSEAAIRASSDRPFSLCFRILQNRCDFRRERRPPSPLDTTCLQSFKAAYEQLVRGDDGMILESAIEPVKNLPTQADVNQAKLSDAQVKEVRDPPPSPPSPTQPPPSARKWAARPQHVLVTPYPRPRGTRTIAQTHKGARGHACALTSTEQQQ